MIENRHGRQKTRLQPHYRSLRCEQMTDEEIRDTVDLFNNNYGVWAVNDNPKRIPGNRIRMSYELMKRTIVEKPDRYIAMAYIEDRLVGYAYYMRRKTTGGNMVTWILQLVVDVHYRGNNIGTKIMHAIWKMSDSWAWGLYTSNPFTIQCLQDATMRKVKSNLIKLHLDELKTVADDLFQDSCWINTYENGIVNTNFPIDFTQAVGNFHNRFPKTRFDLDENLPIGSEWLAFVFSDQKPKPTMLQLSKYLDFSDEITKDAYARMEMDKHGWASHTEEEVDFITNANTHIESVLDIGCGRGRHSCKLAEKGIDTVGVDYVEVPPEIKKKENEKLHFECADARTVSFKRKFDCVIALYDVIGSYSNEKDNLKILQTAYKSLKQKGKLIISVMNMELTKEECQKNKNLVSGIRKNVFKLITLKSSNTMQKSGQVFDGRFIILDTSTGECYRKELFFCEDSLPIEYIVRDRRYTQTGISKLLQAAGFIVEECYCVQAGRFNKRLQPDDPRAKEILVIARKATFLQNMFRSHDINECWL